MMTWSITVLVAAFVWGGYWLFRIRPCWLVEAGSAAAGNVALDRLSVIIPARNEARTLPVLLEDLSKEGPADMEIIVVDDHSVDATSACVREAARSDSRVRLVRCPEKPDAWSGKNWAIARGVAEASGEWLLFCDADVSIGTGTIAAAAGIIREESLDALSLIPGMANRRPGPAFLLACLAVSRAILFRPSAPARRGLVQGAFLAVKRSAYDAIEGHEGNKETLIEDVEMGYRLHDDGFRVRTYPARRWISTTMYETLDETRSGLQKHLFASMSFSFPRLLCVVALHLFLFLMPFVSLLVSVFLAAVGGATAPELAVAGASGLCLVTMYAVAGRLIRAESLPPVSALALPISYFGMAAVLAASVSGYRQGEISWKGRKY